MDARTLKLARCYKIKAEEAQTLVDAGLGHPRLIKQATDKQVKDLIGKSLKVKK